MENSITENANPPQNQPRLYGQLRQLRDENNAVRMRNAAKQLKVSEAELVASQCGTDSDEKVVRLQEEWEKLIRSFEALGEAMALTRNDQAVHEVTGHYQNISFQGGHGLVHEDNIDLRLFTFCWQYCFAVETTTKRGIRRSFQFFDNEGTAVHKVYLTSASNITAFHQIVDTYRHADQRGILAIAAGSPKPEINDKEIDIPGFRQAWQSLQDTHDFFGMLRRFNVTRTQALRLAPEDYARQVAVSSAVQISEQAKADQTPIMIFAGNRGCIQIYSGTINKLVRTGEWFNILDPGFNLHLKDGEIAQTWMVKKPTVDGIVTSVELFDHNNQVIAMFFGVRKPGQQEDERWRTIVNALPAS